MILKSSIYAAAGESIDGTSCVSVQLAAQRARALALLGDRAGAETAMARGRARLAQLPAPAHPEHHFVIDPAKADFYAVDVYRTLDMRRAASEHAHRVLDYCERPDGSVRSPMRRSEALLTLGAIAAREGELDEAVAHGLTALREPRSSLPSLLTVAADLDGELHAHRDDPIVRQWRDVLRSTHAPHTLGA